MFEKLIELAPIMVAFGMFYGATNSRIKALEKNHEDSSGIGERLAILETKIDLLISKNKNNA
jgi:hypothetical protein